VTAGRQVRIVLVGANGRMGEALRAAAAAQDSVAITGMYAARAHPQHGIAALDALDAAGAFDVLVDFSRPEALEPLVAACVRRGSALLTGTTGFAQPHLELLQRAAADIPVLSAANFSIGVAVLEALVERAARALPEWDCDILEMHHRDKRDAPSGTALLLGFAVSGERAAADAPPVQYASLRCGDIVGEHAVQFTGFGERLELVHRATDRGIFARGALEAARRLHGRPAGRYRFAELVAG